MREDVTESTTHRLSDLVLEAWRCGHPDGCAADELGPAIARLARLASARHIILGLGAVTAQDGGVA
jgi:hypothetical protein